MGWAGIVKANSMRKNASSKGSIFHSSLSALAENAAVSSGSDVSEITLKNIAPGLRYFRQCATYAVKEMLFCQRKCLFRKILIPCAHIEV